MLTKEEAGLLKTAVGYAQHSAFRNQAVRDSLYTAIDRLTAERVAEAIAADARVYGHGYALHRADGTVEHVPTESVLLVQASTVPAEIIWYTNHADKTRIQEAAVTLRLTAAAGEHEGLFLRQLFYNSRTETADEGAAKHAQVMATALGLPLRKVSR